MIIKSIYVTVAQGCETNYYCDSYGLANTLRNNYGISLVDTLRILMKIRRKENSLLIKRYSYFNLSNTLLKTNMIDWR